MIEKKFRAWDKDQEKMFHFSLFNSIAIFVGHEEAEGGFKTLEGRSIFTWFLKGNRTIIMQYTGLKDDDGKECYEKDIIAITTQTFDEDGNYKGDKYTDIRECPSIDDYLFYGLLDSSQHNQTQSFKIIGNVYSNPELLRRIK